MSAFDEPVTGGTIDLVALLQRYALGLVAAVSLGAVAGYAASYLVTQQWEGSATLLVGHVGSRLGDRVGADADRIEPPGRAVERVQAESFKRALVQGFEPPATTAEADLIQSSLRATVAAGDVVKIQTRALSQTRAREIADLVVRQLRRTHEELARPARGALERELLSLDGEIASMEKELARLRAAESSGRDVPADRRFSELVLLASTINSLDGDLRERRDRQADVREYLNVGRTFPTRQLEPTSVSEKPVWPRRRVFAAAGAVVGLLALALYIGLRPSRRATVTQGLGTIAR